jgi:hypothetical protein
MLECLVDSPVANIECIQIRNVFKHLVLEAVVCRSKTDHTGARLNSRYFRLFRGLWTLKFWALGPYSLLSTYSLVSVVHIICLFWLPLSLINP